MEELTPITRREVFLAKAAGQEVETPTPVTREEVFLDAIAKGSDSPLPAVTSSDNGKVLGVADGAWAKLGGGGSLPPVTASDNGKVLGVVDGAWAAGVQEYWIPVTESVLGLSIPSDKKYEVQNAIINPEKYFVRGICVNGSGYFAGYVSNSTDFIVPMSKSKMYELAGIDCEGRVHICYKSGIGYEVTIEPSKFIVTLTPTSPDFSGTMDKTPAEITAAYNAGQEIVFDIPALNAKVNATQFLEVNEVIRAGGMVFYDVNSSPVIITVVTSGVGSTYATQVFAMTPAS